MTDALDRHPVLVLTGTTASGKNRTGAHVASRVGGEVISLDSMKVYRGMNIGTAKPTVEERAGVPHHLLDILDPTESMDLRTFVARAEAIRREVVSRGKVPVVVGGTQLYLHGFLEGVFDGPAADEAFRTAFRAEADRLGDAVMHARLAAVDPETAARLHVNDRKRVERALEVFVLTGTPISVLRREGTVKAKFPNFTAVLTWRRDVLDARIHARVVEMFREGFVEEVRSVLASGGFGRTSGAALGYEEAVAVAEGRLPIDVAVERVSAKTRRFARKQLTWLRKLPHDLWIEAEHRAELEAAGDRVAEAFTARFPSTP
jgi:tRNA dimethylallyltransferase